MLTPGNTGHLQTERRNEQKQSGDVALGLEMVHALGSSLLHHPESTHEHYNKVDRDNDSCCSHKPHTVKPVNALVSLSQNQCLN